MTRNEHIEQIANLVAVRLGDAPLDVMGQALVLNLASCICGYPPERREIARKQFQLLLEARIEQLVQAGKDEVLESPETQQENPHDPQTH